MSSLKRKADVVIVGGGASGLAAAITLGMESSLDVLVIEKLSEPARKIRATGNGRCNISNTAAPGYLKIAGFFTRIGLVTRAYDNGLVYPYSESAADVADILISRTKQLGARIACGEEVVSIKQIKGPGRDSDLSASRRDGNKAAAENSTAVTRFEIMSKYKDADGEHTAATEAAYVILACGGKAGPMFGTTGDGYRLARTLGHSVVTPVPVLTGIECREWSKDHIPCALTLAGTRTRGRIALYRYIRDDEAAAREELFKEEGEIQFTKYGLSGICVFNMTRHMRFDPAGGGSLSDFLITADLYPDGDIEEAIRERRAHAFPGESAGKVLTGVLKENVADHVMKSLSASGMDVQNKALKDITDEEIKAIGRKIYSMEFSPMGLKGWKDAQATSGGIRLSEIDEETSESKIAGGLYITGELADRDYQCGGFNLSNAWLTGITAAESIIYSCR